MPVIIVCVIFFILGCAHNKPVQNSKSEIEADREQLQARDDVFNYNSFKQQAMASADNLKSLQNNSQYGFSRATVGCKKSDTRVSDVVVGSLIESTLGAPESTDINKYSACTNISYSNWLKLNWSCAGEEASFYKSNTSNVLRSGLKITFLDKDEKNLGMVDLKTNELFESFDLVSDEIFNMSLKLKIIFKDSVMIVDRANLSRTVVLQDSICNRGN